VKCRSLPHPKPKLPASVAAIGTTEIAAPAAAFGPGVAGRLTSGFDPEEPVANGRFRMRYSETLGRKLHPREDRLELRLVADRIEFPVHFQPRQARIT